MRAARYRLRFFTGATLNSATYGGGLYGDGTYGTQASDALTTAHHRLVPWPGGALTAPSWRYRQHDTMPPWEAQIIADDGVVSYDGLASAHLILTPVDGQPEELLPYPLTIVTAANGDERLHHDWDIHDLDQPGVYRVTVVLIYTSGRRFTIQPDDRHTLIINADGS